MKKLIAVMAAFAVLFCFACANMRVVHEIEVGTGDDVKIGIPTSTDYTFQNMASAFGILDKEGEMAAQGIFYNYDMYEVMKGSAEQSEKDGEIADLKEVKKDDFEGFAYTFKYGEDDHYASVYLLSENTMLLFTGTDREKMDAAIDALRIEVKVGVREAEETVEEQTENTETKEEENNDK